jgi:hypothetical protein
MQRRRPAAGEAFGREADFVSRKAFGRVRKLKPTPKFQL